MGFARPTRTDDGGREYFQAKHFDGELAIFKVNNQDPEYKNPRFEKDKPRGTVWADITIVTGPGTGKVFPNAEFGGDYVHEALAEYAGTDTLVLGRIVKGEIGGKPWFVNDPTEEDEALAEAFLSNQDETAEDEAAEDGPGPYGDYDPRDEDTSSTEDVPY